MTDPEIRFDELIAALKEKKFRLTPQRIELVRLIASSEGQPHVRRSSMNASIVSFPP